MTLGLAFCRCVFPLFDYALWQLKVQPVVKIGQRERAADSIKLHNGVRRGEHFHFPASLRRRCSTEMASSGGKWDRVEPMLSRALCKRDVAAYVYDFD